MGKSPCNDIFLPVVLCLRAFFSLDEVWNENTTIRNKYNKQPFSLQVVPYRESKLTMILQPLLSVAGPKSLLVNINTTPQLFDETVNVLKFSCVAKSVNFKEPPAPVPKIRIPAIDSAENSQSSTNTSDVESNKSSDSSSEKLNVWLFSIFGSFECLFYVVDCVC